jgi:hypothetical protein
MKTDRDISISKPDLRASHSLPNILNHIHCVSEIPFSFALSDGKETRTFLYIICKNKIQAD